MLFDTDISRVNKLGRVRVFRCKICQEAYIGEESPSRCPFCGAPKRYFILAKEWDQSEYIVEISDVSKGNLEADRKLLTRLRAVRMSKFNNLDLSWDCDEMIKRFEALKRGLCKHRDSCLYGHIRTM